MNLNPQHNSTPNRSSAAQLPTIKLQDVSLHLASKAILHHISFELTNGITSLIGPSGAGKSSLLRCINMLYTKWAGNIQIHGQDIKSWQNGIDDLRKHVGLIAQKPAVFPVSIADNVTFGLSYKQRQKNMSTTIKQSLIQAALWDEVKDRLNQSATTLSIGQQQRLCLARALTLKPSVLLLDEPTASLDPHSKQLIETSLHQLAQSIPVLCVTHDLEQASRLKGQVVFMCDGKIIETANCQSFFNQPKKLETREFLRWSVCDCS